MAVALIVLLLKSLSNECIEGKGRKRLYIFRGMDRLGNQSDKRVYCHSEGSGAERTLFKGSGDGKYVFKHLLICYRKHRHGY